MNLNAELRPRRELLNPKFEGYKLNLDQLPIVSRELASKIVVFSAKPNEINYINLALYAQHTATFTDRWMDGICWFTKEQDGYSVVEYKNDKVDRLFNVEIPNEHALPTVHFPLDEVYLIGNGNSKFTLYAKDQVKMNGQIPTGFDNDDDMPVLINHTKITDNLEELFLVATFVRDKECTVIYAQYELDTGRCTHSEIFKSHSVPSFVAIGSNYDLILMSDKLIKHSCDEKLPPVKVLKYKWRQNMSDLIVFIELDKRPEKGEIRIKISQRKLEVSVVNGHKGKIEFGGELFDQIDPEASNWEISPGGIEITLQKEIERGWQTVLKENDCGEEVFNEEFVSQVRDRLSHLTSDHPMPDEAEKPGVDGHQLEDCDRVSEFERIVYRFCIQQREWSHKASLASNAPILTTYLDKNVKALGLRMDVDCCIWDTEYMDKKTPMNHIATFDGVGYIHAGKTGLAFSQVSPDNKFLVLVDINRRAVVYRRNCPLTTNLRNRSTGARVNDIGRQQMVNVQTTESFVSAQCSNNYLFLFTKSALWRCEINPVQLD